MANDVTTVLCVAFDFLFSLPLNYIFVPFLEEFFVLITMHLVCYLFVTIYCRKKNKERGGNEKEMRFLKAESIDALEANFRH